MSTRLDLERDQDLIARFKRAGQSAVARRAGYSIPHLHNWLHGKGVSEAAAEAFRVALREVEGLPPRAMPGAAGGS